MFERKSTFKHRNKFGRRNIFVGDDVFNFDYAKGYSMDHLNRIPLTGI